MSKTVTAYKSVDGTLFDTADKALDHDVYTKFKQKYRSNYNTHAKDMRPLYKLLKGYYDG
jgi:hypothetical protein